MSTTYSSRTPEDPTSGHYVREYEYGDPYVEATSGGGAEPPTEGQIWPRSSGGGQQGPAGPAGAAGATGPAGATGATGATGAAGSSILSGAGNPADALGVVGNYYLDTTNDTLYGPKEPAGAEQKLSWAGSPNNSYSGGFAIRVSFSLAGQIVRVRYYANSAATRTIKVWSEAGVELSSVSHAAPSAGWHEATLSTPAVVTPGDIRLVYVTSTSLAFLYPSGVLPTSTANMTALDCRETGTIGAFPTTVSNSALANFIEPIFSTGVIWPLALTGADAHLVDTTAAHAASAISFTPAGTIAATDVQAAIAEVASEASAGGTTILNGSGVPADALGAVGNYYLDTTNDKLYGPKAASASGTLFDSYPITNQSQTQSCMSGQPAYAQSFTGVAGPLTTVEFALAKTGSPTGNVVSKLYAHTGSFGETGKPTGGALATSSNVAVTTLTTYPTMAVVAFSFPTPYTLVAGTKYCVSVEYSGAGSVEVGLDAIMASHAGNGAYNNGSVWVDQEAYDAIFYAYGAGGSLWPVNLISATAAGPGTTILSGAGAPAEGLGSDGQYYLDTTNHILYGPKATVAASPEELGLTTEAFYDGNTSPLREWGNAITFSAAGSVTGVRYQRKAAHPATITFRAWKHTSNGKLAEVSDTRAGADGWFLVNFPTPVTIISGAVYVFSYSVTTGFPPTPNVYPTVTNTAHMTYSSGRFSSGSVDVYPSNTGTGTQNITPVFGMGTVGYWPVAVYGIPTGGTTGQSLKKSSGTDYAVAWTT